MFNNKSLPLLHASLILIGPSSLLKQHNNDTYFLCYKSKCGLKHHWGLGGKKWGKANLTVKQLHMMELLSSYQNSLVVWWKPNLCLNLDIFNQSCVNCEILHMRNGYSISAWQTKVDFSVHRPVKSAISLKRYRAIKCNYLSGIKYMNARFVSACFSVGL